MPLVTALLLSTVPGHHIGPSCILWLWLDTLQHFLRSYAKGCECPSWWAYTLVVVVLRWLVTSCLKLMCVDELISGSGNKFHEPTKNFVINFLFFNAWKLLKIMLKYPYLCVTLSSTPKCYFLAGSHFFIRKMKIKMTDRKKHVLSKVVKTSNVLQI